MRKTIRIVLLSLLVCILGISNCYAREEASLEGNVRNGWLGFYKNFIVELGGIKISLYSNELMSGVSEPVWTFNVYPKQWQGKNEVKRKFAESTKSIFMQKNNGMIILSSVKEMNNNVKYSNNIPQITDNEDANGNVVTYAYFTKWNQDNGQSFTNVDLWKDYNNGENIDLLAKDLGVDNHSAYKNISTGEQMKLSEWIKQPGSNGYTPTIVIEPLTIYPDTTEQIYCSNLSIAKQYIFQWGIKIAETYNMWKEENDRTSKTEEYTSKKDGYTISYKTGGIGLIEFLSKDIYYDCGILQVKTVEMTTSSRGNVNYDSSSVEVERIEQPKYINLTHYGTKKHSVPYSTKGIWVNFKKQTRTTVYTEEGMKAWYEEEIRVRTHDIESSEKTTINAVKSMYPFEQFVEEMGYEKRSDGKYYKTETKGIGEATKINTDHNKYVVIIYESDDEKVREIQNKLSDLGVLYPACEDGIVYLYGGWMLGSGIATASEIGTPSDIAGSSSARHWRPEDIIESDRMELFDDEISYFYDMTNIDKGRYRTVKFGVNKGHPNRLELEPVWEEEDEDGVWEVKSGKGKVLDCRGKVEINGKKIDSLTFGNFNPYFRAEMQGTEDCVITGNSINCEINKFFENAKEGFIETLGTFNQELTAYRDKEYDLRTLYPGYDEEGNKLNSDEVISDMNEFGIYEGYIPHSNAKVSDRNKSINGVNQENPFDTDFRVQVEMEDTIDGETCDCVGELHMTKGGETYEEFCYAGRQKGYFENGNEVINSYNKNGVMKQYWTVGEATDESRLKKITKSEGSKVRSLYSAFNTVWGVDNDISGLSQRNIEYTRFYPYVKMQYATLDKRLKRDVYILSQNESKLPESVIIKVGTWKRPDNSIGVDSNWVGWTQGMDVLSANGVHGGRSLVAGGSEMTLYTVDSLNNGERVRNADECDSADICLQAYITCVGDNVITNDEVVEATYDYSTAKNNLIQLKEDVLTNLRSYTIENWMAEGIYSNESEFNNKAVCIDGINRRSIGENNNWGQSKYYLNNSDGGDIRNNGKIDARLVAEEGYEENEEEGWKLEGYMITSDVNGNITLWHSADIKEDVGDYSSFEAVKTFEGKKYNSSTDLDDEWKALNNENYFVDNFIKSLDFNIGIGGRTYKNGQLNSLGRGWYNEAVGKGIAMCLKSSMLIHLGLNEYKYDVIDPGLCGTYKDESGLGDTFSDEEINRKWRTFRYRVSERPETYNEKGYLATFDEGGFGEIKIYCNNIQELLKTKLMYLGNVVVNDLSN